MSEAAKFSTVELTRSEQQIEIRALRADDQANMVAAIGRSGAPSLYRRLLCCETPLQREGDLVLPQR